MKFEMVEGVTLADAAVRSYGKDFNELFMNTALGLSSLIIRNPEKILPRETVSVNLTDDNAGMLLFDFLNEFLFHLDSASLLLLPESISVTESSGLFSLTASLRGETIDRQRHEMNSEVKAVTLHKFRISGTAGSYEAFVVYDL